MTPEDKELLLKDLCARLPYGVKIQSNESKITATLLRGGQYEDGEIYRGLEDFIETAMSRKFHIVFDKERVRKVLGDLAL